MFASLQSQQAGVHQASAWIAGHVDMAAKMKRGPVIVSIVLESIAADPDLVSNSLTAIEGRFGMFIALNQRPCRHPI